MTAAERKALQRAREEAGIRVASVEVPDEFVLLALDRAWLREHEIDEDRTALAHAVERGIAELLKVSRVPSEAHVGRPKLVSMSDSPQAKRA